VHRGATIKNSMRCQSLEADRLSRPGLAKICEKMLVFAT
jgi:hypothetical protein